MKLTHLFLLFALASPLLAQNNVRWDLPIYTVQAQGGNLLPVYAIPGAGIKFYSCSGSTCTTLATTYISATSATTCPTSPTPMQVTLNGSSTCVSTADPYGNMGGWFQPGEYMAAISAQGTTYNYYFTIGASGLFCPSPGCVITGNLIVDGSVNSPSLPLTTTNPAYGTCDPTGVADSTTCMTNAIADAISKGAILHVLHGTYKLTSQIVEVFSTSLHIEADEGTVFDFSSSSTTSAPDLLLGGAAPTQTAALSSDVSAGANSISTTLGPSLTAGNVILITSTTRFDPSISSPSGEMAQVQAVSGNTVTLTSGLIGSYTAATTTIELMNMPRIILKNIQIKCNPAVASWGLNVEYAQNLLLDKVTFNGCQERSAQLAYIFHGLYDNGSTSGMLSTANGTNYGLIVATAQYLTVSNGYFIGGREGLDFGGFEPNRFDYAFGNTVGNLSTSASASFVSHGNSEFMTAFGNTFLNGSQIDARNWTFENNRAFAPSAAQVCFYLTPQISGSYFRLLHNTCRNAHYGVIFEPLTNLTVNHLDLANNDFSVTTEAVQLEPAASTTSTLTQFSSVDDTMGTSGTYPYSLEVNPASATSFSLPSLTITGGTWTTVLFSNCSTCATDMWYGGGVTADLTNSTYGIRESTSGLNSLTVDGAKFYSPTSAGVVGVYVDQVTDSAIVTHSRFVNMSSSNNIIITAGCATVDGTNRYPNSTGGLNLHSSPTCNAYPNFTLTTTGTSGAATLTGDVLNIPNYSVSTPARGAAVLSSGTVTVSNSAACAIGSTCVYKLANCSPSGSAIGVPSIGTITAGTSFVINSLSAANAVVTGDTSTICWQIN